tara:strand:+ start:124 stop:882 length:759 start_codon:yes stop_codon:yes gene_type:complete
MVKKKKTNNKSNFGFIEVDTEEKPKLVNEVFDNVSEYYDLMNDLLSFGAHRLWKRLAVELSSIREDFKVLDIAGGTGDITKLISSKIGEGGQLILSDFNKKMLLEGRNRLLDSGINNVSYAQINAQYLPFNDDSFDLVTVAFGLRNFAEKEIALESIYNSLKPKGSLMVLEFSKPQNEVFKELYDLYSFEVMPIIGNLITKSSESYRYLAESIRMHPDQDELKALFEETGFTNCSYENLFNGIVAIHRGFKE